MHATFLDANASVQYGEKLYLERKTNKFTYLLLINFYSLIYPNNLHRDWYKTIRNTKNRITQSSLKHSTYGKQQSSPQKPPLCIIYDSTREIAFLNFIFSFYLYLYHFFLTLLFLCTKLLLSRSCLHLQVHSVTTNQ